jgi:hypothetical protein
MLVIFGQWTRFEVTQVRTIRIGTFMETIQWMVHKRRIDARDEHAENAPPSVQCNLESGWNSTVARCWHDEKHPEESISTEQGMTIDKRV